MTSGDRQELRAAGETTASGTTASGRGPTRRRVLASVGVAAAVALAGCSGGDGDGPSAGDGDGGDGSPTNGDPGGDGGSTADPTDAPTDGAGAGGDGEEGLALYRFTRPERYVYETVDGLTFDGAAGRLVVDVVEADGETATVDLGYEAGEYAAEDTVSDRIDEIGTALGLSSAGGYLFSMGAVGISGYLASRTSVSVGDVWEVGTTERVRTEITERATVAGVDGYRFVTSLVDSEEGAREFVRGVYSPDLQILAEKVMEDDEGEVVLSMTLVDYERR